MIQGVYRLSQLFDLLDILRGLRALKSFRQTPRVTEKLLSQLFASLFQRLKIVAHIASALLPRQSDSG
jgi:hypothetical protein